MLYMFSEMQNKLSKTRESPLESMGQMISSRCPSGPYQAISDNKSSSVTLHKLSMNARRLYCNLMDLPPGSLNIRPFYFKVGSKSKILPRIWF